MQSEPVGATRDDVTNQEASPLRARVSGRAATGRGVADPGTPPVVADVPEPSARWLTWALSAGDGGMAEIAEYLAYAAFADGREPYAHTVSVEALKNPPWRLPAGARVLRAVRSDDNAMVVAVGDGWTMAVSRWHSQAGTVTVTAGSAETARRVAETAAKLVRRRVRKSDDIVHMGFWHLATRGPERRMRAIAAPTWAAVRRNYARGVAAQFDRLMAATPESINGRLILLHGPPGTGKTSALRSLGMAWQNWCAIDCILDPEALFATPGYLLEVVMGAEHAQRSARHHWRLLILEDCDELVRGGAKQAAGQALSRLLNLTDGLLGQGQHVLVAITTNEELGRMHPAVIRPGRCLAQIEVGPLPPDEATAWLDTGERVAAPATLAELYARRAGETSAAPLTAAAPTGLYI